MLRRVVKVSERWVTEVSCHLDTMLCAPGFRWIFLNAVLHTVAPWGAQRPGRPRQCDAPKSVSSLGHFLRQNTLMQKLFFQDRLENLGKKKLHLWAGFVKGRRADFTYSLSLKFKVSYIFTITATNNDITTTTTTIIIHLRCVIIKVRLFSGS